MPETKEEKEKGGEGGGGGGATEDQALERLGKKLADAAGSANLEGLKGIVQEFYRDAVDLRTRNRELNTQLTEVRKKLPKEGEVVLSVEDAKAFAEVQKLNIPLKDLPKKITEGATAQQKLVLVERDKVADEVAKLHEHPAAVLRAVVRTQNLNLRVREEADPSGAVDKEGKKKTRKVAEVIPEGENQQAVPWLEYLDKNLGDFREALAGSEADRNGGNRESQSGPRITRQRSDAGGPGKAVTDEQLEATIAARHGGALRI